MMSEGRLALACFLAASAIAHAADGEIRISAQTEGAAVRFLLFSYPIDVTVSSEEYPPYAIRIHSLKGNLRRLEGGYQIAPRAGGEIELSWKGLIEPDSFLPALITKPVLRAVVEAQFSGMVSEIRRRSAASNP
jgi:hypothetical protein